jgi:hypothetical protein
MPRFLIRFSVIRQQEAISAPVPAPDAKFWAVDKINGNAYKWAGNGLQNSVFICSKIWSLHLHTCVLQICEICKRPSLESATSFYSSPRMPVRRVAADPLGGLDGLMARSSTHWAFSGRRSIFTSSFFHNDPFGCLRFQGLDAKRLSRP